MLKSRSLFAFGWVILAGCATSIYPAGLRQAPPLVASATASQEHQTRPRLTQRSSKKFIFVADSGGFSYPNGKVVLFSDDSAPMPVATITDGIFRPTQIGFDSKSTLYAANETGVTEYKEGSSKPFITLKSGAVGLALGENDVLYVSDGASSISEYLPAHKAPFKRFTGLPQPLGLAIDKAQNLYFASSYEGVFEIPKGSSVPKNLGLMDTGAVVGEAFDSEGNLFVSNCDKGYEGTVTLYHVGQKHPYLTISRQGDCPYDLSVASTGQLFVPYISSGTVAIFKPGAHVPYIVFNGNLYPLVSPASAVVRSWPKPK
jgi:hypothetical protein